ncbi:hypothetical protein BT69DRAFT_1303186 [Atractiella rhizophila]|nr:hypothetical protein BT69DRAFT_1303186 [Atractiella rhizophila]
MDTWAKREWHNSWLLNDFDGFAECKQGGKKKHKGNMNFPSECTAGCPGDHMYNTGNDRRYQNEGKDTDIDNVNLTNDDNIMGDDSVAEGSGKSSRVKSPPPPPQFVRPLHQHDDIESTPSFQTFSRCSPAGKIDPWGFAGFSPHKVASLPKPYFLLLSRKCVDFPVICPWKDPPPFVRWSSEEPRSSLGWLLEGELYRSMSMEFLNRPDGNADKLPHLCAKKWESENMFVNP